jgi:hypothetical protein
VPHGGSAEINANARPYQRKHGRKAIRVPSIPNVSEVGSKPPFTVAAMERTILWMARCKGSNCYKISKQQRLEMTTQRIAMTRSCLKNLVSHCMI